MDQPVSTARLRSDAVAARRQAELKYWGEAKPKPRPKQRRKGSVKWNRPNRKWEACLRSRYLGIFADRADAEAAVTRAIAAAAVPVRPNTTRIMENIKQVAGRRFAKQSPPTRRVTLGELWGIAA